MKPDRSQSAIEQAGESRRAIRLLLIEDSPDDAAYIMDILQDGVERNVYEVRWVERLSDAFAVMSERAFDAALLDLSLSDSFGIETVARFRDSEPNIPVIVLTGLDSERTGIDAIKAGAQDYLVKSGSTPDRIMRAIRYALERFEMQKEMRRKNDEFNAILSHELRSPVTAIKGAVECMVGEPGEFNQSRSTGFLDMIARNAARLEKTITNVLALSRLESGRALLSRHAIRPADVIAECVESHRADALKKGVQIESVIAPGLPLVYADPGMLEEVLTNLLNNALRFAKNKIIIQVDRGAAGMTVSVLDDGPGIPEDQVRRVFEKFVQIKTADRRSNGKGAGLGLAICGMIMDLHEGRIWAENRPGGGAAFHFCLPVFDRMTAFKDMLAVAVQSVLRKKAILSLLVVTIRNVHQVIAQIGESSREALYSVLCEKISGRLRQEDRLMRLKEFLIILAETDRAGAVAMWNRIEPEVRGPFRVGDIDVQQLGFDTGVATFPNGTGIAPGNLLENALRDLHQPAKA